MKKKLIFFLVVTVLIFGLGIQLGLSQDREKVKLDTTAEIMSKLKEVLANQAEILNQFEEVKQELAVIKIRATRR